MEFDKLVAAIENEASLIEQENDRFNEIDSIFFRITKRHVYRDFNFPLTGGVLGILRSFSTSYEYQETLSRELELPTSYSQLFFRYCGNLPYYDVKNNIVNGGREMDVDKTRAILFVVAKILKLHLTESDLNEITQERWNTLKNQALERAKDSAQLQHNIEYDE